MDSEYSHGWAVLWPHGGFGAFYRTRYDVMEWITTEAYWREAVIAAGYILNDMFWDMLEVAEFENRVKKAIHKPEIVRKIWNRIKRREGLRIVKATEIIQPGWVEMS